MRASIAVQDISKHKTSRGIWPIWAQQCVWFSIGVSRVGVDNSCSKLLSCLRNAGSLQLLLVPENASTGRIGCYLQSIISDQSSGLNWPILSGPAGLKGISD